MKKSNILPFTPPVPADETDLGELTDEDFEETEADAVTIPQSAIDLLQVSALTLALGEIIARASLIPGCTAECVGRESGKPIVWMYGIGKEYRDMAMALGARWSPSRQAWWTTADRFHAKNPTVVPEYESESR